VKSKGRRKIKKRSNKMTATSGTSVHLTSSSAFGLGTIQEALEHSYNVGYDMIFGDRKLCTDDARTTADHSSRYDSTSLDEMMLDVDHMNLVRRSASCNSAADLKRTTFKQEQQQQHDVSSTPPVGLARGQSCIETASTAESEKQYLFMKQQHTGLSCVSDITECSLATEATDDGVRRRAKLLFTEGIRIPEEDTVVKMSRTKKKSSKRSNKGNGRVKKEKGSKQKESSKAKKTTATTL
jgi:hypothetical protein